MGWSEVQMIARSLLQPLANQCCFVRAVVIQHQMNVEIGGNGPIDLLQEIEKLDGAMTPVALAEHAAGGDIESRKQAGDAVSFVIVRAPLQLSGLHRQHWLGAAERLNLRLLVHAQHQRMMGRIKIESHNISYLVDQQWICR